MEGFVAQKLNEFETGKISRRKLIETLTLAATTAAAADSARALRADRGLLAASYLGERLPRDPRTR